MSPGVPGSPRPWWSTLDMTCAAYTARCALLGTERLNVYTPRSGARLDRWVASNWCRERIGWPRVKVAL